MPDELRAAIQQFHVALWNGHLVAAWDVVWKPASNGPRFEMFEQSVGKTMRPRLNSWRLRDVRVMQVPLEYRSDWLTGVESIATVTVGIGVTDGGSLIDLDEYWVRRAAHLER